MLVAIVIALVYVILIWLVFFKFRWLKFNIVWGIVSFWIGFHVILIFIIGLRFYAPYTADAHIVRNTIQIVPRLQGPTLLEEVLVTANQPVKKGTPLYKFDDTIYRAQVAEAKAQLVAAQQNVKTLNANLTEAQSQLAQAQSQLDYATAQQKRFTALAPQGGARREDVDKWNAQVTSDTAQVEVAKANIEKAQIALASQIDGENTSVAEAQAKLDQAEYYLKQTTIVAPADGFIVSQQARPGLVVGELRAGSIAVFVVTEDPAYMLGAFFQEHIKFVQPGQPVEIALDINPAEIFTGKVEAVWWATAQGQIRPSGRIPNFILPKLQGKFAIQVTFDDPNAFLPAGTHGAMAIYTGRSKPFELIRRINLRMYSFVNLVYPFNL
ncbi:MAG: HlyD family secretion protein [Albimonas sp.]|uniref:HlyD family secretion protein n=1 Tax=Albimonas sp. TaxID=1872425 RepID=UPI004057963C